MEIIWKKRKKGGGVTHPNFFLGGEEGGVRLTWRSFEVKVTKSESLVRLIFFFVFCRCSVGIV